MMIGCAPVEKLQRKNDVRKLQEVIVSFKKMLEKAVFNGVPARKDGHAYAIDLGNTMRAAVILNNRKLFDQLYKYLTEYFLVTGSGDLQAEYTLVWRWDLTSPKEASGSAETGNAADALWAAYERWGVPEHRELAVKIAYAYIRHGSWLNESAFYVKNYYNYVTKSYSENTWLLNQMPHTLLRIGQAISDTILVRHAIGMANFLRGGYIQQGFFFEMFDPGISTVFKGSTGYFAPNGMLSLGSSLLIARTLLPFTKAPARRFAYFFQDQYPNLYSYYYYNTVERRVYHDRGAQYSIFERGLALDILLSVNRTGYENSDFVRYLIGWDMLPFSERLVGNYFDTFYYEIPLFIEAVYPHFFKSAP